MKKCFVIKKYREYQEIFHLRKFKRNNKFIVNFRKNDNSLTRVGINVGKKNGNAVARNKIKRQIRQIVDECVDYKMNIDLIIAVTKNYKTDEFEDNKIKLTELLNSIIGETNE